MNDATIDDLLDELVPPVQQLPDWAGVLRRARRSRRRHLLAVAIVAALVLVPAAVAVGGLGWFHGKPAPPEIKQEFVRFNEMMRSFTAQAAKQGLRQKAPQAIVARAHGVVALRLPDGGTAYVWAAPQRGGGACRVIDARTRSGKRSFGSAECDSLGQTRKPISYGTLGGASIQPDNLVFGHVPARAATVRVELSNGARLRLPVFEHFFIGLIPKHTHPVQVESYDRDAKRLALVTASGGTAWLSAAERRALSRVSSRGMPFVLPAGRSETKRLVRAGFDNPVELLVTRDDVRYFRLRHKGPHDCFARGRVGRAWPLGAISCRNAAPYFPSAEMPIVDLSTLGATARNHRMRFLHVGGVVADGVARVVVKDREGRGVLWLPVHDNVYDSGATVVPAAAVQLQAQDSHGRTLAQVPR